jgi:hypothetical protein
MLVFLNNFVMKLVSSPAYVNVAHFFLCVNALQHAQLGVGVFLCGFILL